MSVLTSLLNHTFTVSRLDRVFNGQGGWAEARVNVGSVRGRIRPATSAERTVAAQQQRSITHVLYVVAGTDIQRGDQVEGAGLIVDVQGVREPSRAGHHLEIDCQEVQMEAEAEEAGS